MSEHLLRQRQFHGHEHCRPYDRVESHDLLSYKMNIYRPVLIVKLRLIRISKRRDIIRKRIKPHVYYMLLIDRNRYAPVESRSGYAQIFKSLLYKRYHLVSSRFRLKEFRIVFKQIQKSVLIFGKSEKVRFFLGFLHRSSAVRAFTVHKLALSPE